ncbi:MAG: hypothetical protein A2X08_08475 [Bacteroidetes bacterium GWA2_32_17]|nr:MAG: hypothetical protein A2X08_08475 [Bacteroidetes bacterium GWA2_32_17]
MNFQQVQIKIDAFIKHYRIAILGTLLVHAFFLLILVVLEMAKPTVSNQSPFSIEFEAEELPTNNLIPEQNNVQNNGDENIENVKNISSNEADKNKSFDDYYKEIENIVNKSKPKENFVANDYNDKRNLAKDYSKENEFVAQTENEQNKQSANKNSSGKNTYAGNAIITYNLGGRKAVKLPVPAYQCLGSGNVVIEVTVNNLGVVKSATIISSNTSLNESCLSDAAYKSALISKFAIDLKAQPLQKGTINYKFISQ